ncbi:MAG: bifunctional (p)ppGpp synthetase/guanosine-3',5'-bis(diphosphate) 3'-pyrophosphohydrolase [Spirochaetia bacterium]|jgi:GTP pyrophosphokinase|nr:bifunctional (p)ppGpp synthetase/guanosine-3',5'-bis(diphosphate) 3'-pyrophosphohydrolase [Spirochaetia bacterium]
MSDIDFKIRSRDIDTLLAQIESYNPAAELDIVKRAYEFADTAHSGQTRLSGEPYIIHPLEVAINLTQLHMDETSICAALLHDVVEDTGATLDFIADKFSPDVAMLVDGVTKISAMKNKSRTIAQAETLRKMLIATIKDLRVIIIKLADKQHNMRTIMFQREDKQRRIAQETLDIYAPIARRLGISRIGSELEDLSFRVLYRDEYDDIKNRLAQREEQRTAYIDGIRYTLYKRLTEMELKPEITGRAKNYFSIFRKMKMQDKTFDEIYDIQGIRIIADEVKDCYAVLGVIHTLWAPIEGRFKDYIAVPKSNMYQSLHTTVIGPEGHPLEVQIRTREMHETAQMGIAAHWLYKENKTAKNESYKDLAILNDINKLFDEANTSVQFMKDLKMNLYDDEIFVFTPQGKIVKLARESTTIDFAFAIHSEVGMKAAGAKVNGKIVPLRTKLNSGDIIEILTSKTGHPAAAWLKFVKSSGARYKIRSWLRKNNQITDEEEKTERKPQQKETPRAEVIIPKEEQIKLSKISENKRSMVSIEGTANVLIKLSQCCQPIPGDDVVGFITRGRGITIHKRSCPSLKRMEKEKERFVNILWESSPQNMYPIKLAVEASDRVNLLKDVAEEISLSKTNIIKVDANLRNKDHAVLKFILEVSGNKHLGEIIARLKKVKNVTNVYKLNEKVVIK